MTNEEILNLYDGLYEIGQDKELKFPVSLSFELAKTKHLLGPIYQSIIETRQKLVEKYGDQVEEGWLIPNEKLSLFEQELKSLMSTNTYVTIEPIPAEDFKDQKIGIDLMEKILPIIKK